MKLKHIQKKVNYLSFLILLIGILFISGCVGPGSSSPTKQYEQKIEIDNKAFGGNFTTGNRTYEFKIKRVVTDSETQQVDLLWVNVRKPNGSVMMIPVMKHMKILVDNVDNVEIQFLDAVVAEDGSITADVTVSAPTSEVSSKVSTTQTGSPTKTLSEILERGAGISSVKYNAVTTAPGVPPMTQKVWLKKNKMRTEMTMEGQTIVNLINMDAKTMYMYMPAQDTTMGVDFGSAPKPPTESIEEYNPVVIGTETINGKVCIVVEYTAEGAKTKSWIWKDKGFSIRTEISTSAGKTIIEYKNIKFVDIPDSMFELPAGVQITKMTNIERTGAYTGKFNSIYDGTYAGTFNYEYGYLKWDDEKGGWGEINWIPGKFDLRITFETTLITPAVRISGINMYEAASLNITHVWCSDQGFGTGSSSITPSTTMASGGSLPTNPLDAPTQLSQPGFGIFFPNGAVIGMPAHGEEISISSDGKTLSNKPYSGEDTWYAYSVVSGPLSTVTKQSGNYEGKPRHKFTTWDLIKID